MLSIISKPYLDLGKFMFAKICVFWLKHCWFSLKSIEERPVFHLGIY